MSNESSLIFNPVHSMTRIPTRNHEFDAGMDVYANEGWYLPQHSNTKIPLGLRVIIPMGFFLLLQGRSGLSFKHGIFPEGNVIDRGYTGEIHVCLYNTTMNGYQISKGDRIAQLLLLPVCTPSEVINTTTEQFDRLVALYGFERGDNGEGSSGK